MEYEIRRTNRADGMVFFKDKEMVTRLEYSLELHRLNKYLEAKHTPVEIAKANESIRQIKIVLEIKSSENLMFGMDS